MYNHLNPAKLLGIQATPVDSPKDLRPGMLIAAQPLKSLALPGALLIGVLEEVIVREDDDTGLLVARLLLLDRNGDAFTFQLYAGAVWVLSR